MWFLYSLSKELMFVPIASAMTATHRGRPAVASVAQTRRYSLLFLEVRLFLLTSRDERTDTQLEA